MVSEWLRRWKWLCRALWCCTAAAGSSGEAAALGAVHAARELDRAWLLEPRVDATSPPPPSPSAPPGLQEGAPPVRALPAPFVPVRVPGCPVSLASCMTHPPRLSGVVVATERHVLAGQATRAARAHRRLGGGIDDVIRHPDPLCTFDLGAAPKTTHAAPTVILLRSFEQPA